MERDFWNRNRLLGHMPLLVSPTKGLMIMTDLAFRSKGYPGNCVVFEGPYEDAVSKFEDRAINGVEMF